MSKTVVISAIVAALLAATPLAVAGPTVTVDVSGTSVGSIGNNFLGFSYEEDPSVNSGLFDTKANLPNLLTNLGAGEIRFGGNSVDRTYAGATPAALSGLRRLSDATGWKVIYSVNLGTFNAANVTKDAKAVTAALGPDLIGIACGNEPNVYGKNGHRPSTYTVQDYLSDAKTCIGAVHGGAAKAKIDGPDTIGTSWLSTYASTEKGTISVLDQHYYALSNCHGPSGTATDLISRTKAAAEASFFKEAVGDARTAGVPLRVTETNSASCGGITGVSDTFASALWAADYALIAAENGASGVNFHGGLNTSCGGYTPLCQGSGGGYAAQPVYYGLLFAHLTGVGRLLPVTIGSAGNVAAHAVRAADGTVRVLLENLDPTATTISLSAGKATGKARVLRLTASGLSATSGVQIQGQSIGSDGLLKPGKPESVSCTAGTCQVQLPATSAAIITLPKA